METPALEADHASDLIAGLFTCPDLDPFLILPFQPAEELQFVWCELLSQALAAVWSSSVAADPNLWLKWEPQSLKDCPPPTKQPGLDHRVLISNGSCCCR